MAWAQPDNFYQWDRTTNTGEHTLIPMSSDYSIEVKNIVSNGEDVNTFTLKPTAIQRQTVDPDR